MNISTSSAKIVSYQTPVFCLNRGGRWAVFIGSFTACQSGYHPQVLSVKSLRIVRKNYNYYERKILKFIKKILKYKI